MLPCRMLTRPEILRLRPLRQAFLPPSLGSSALLLLVVFLLAPSLIGAQALSTEKLKNGTEMMLITRPLAEIDAACFSDPKSEGGARCVVAPELLFASVVESELGEAPSPRGLVILTGSGQRGILERLSKLLEENPPSSTAPPVAAGLKDEGGVERRLGAPGARSSIELRIPLPNAADPRRSAIEVIWEMLPGMLVKEFPSIRAHIDGAIGILNLEVEGESAELRLSELRLALARRAADPSLDPEAILSESHRLQIARMANLEDPESAGRTILSRWQEGGLDAVREYLFGLKSVDRSLVMETMNTWLRIHPGRAAIRLPPRIFQPRFAPGPVAETLDNNLSAAVLERPQIGLSALVLRPILLSGIGGGAEAVVLARVGQALRTGGLPLPSVEVRSDPPRLELVADADDFALLCEALQRALEEVASDQNPVSGSLESRDRSLQLLGRILGLNSGKEISASDILAPGNLALGALAPDAETALEALRKFGVGGEKRKDQLLSIPIESAFPHREAAAGSKSAVAAAIPVDASWPVPPFIKALFKSRAEKLWSEARVEVLQPLIPGRKVLVLLVEAEKSGTELEDQVRGEMDTLISPVDEELMVELRRKVVLEETKMSSGIIGRARLCSAIAAGEAAWRAPAQQEIQIMSTEPEILNQALEALRAETKIEWTTVGPMALDEEKGTADTVEK